MNALCIHLSCIAVVVELVPHDFFTDGVYVMPNVALTRFAQQQDIAPPPNPRLYDIWSDTLQM